MKILKWVFKSILIALCVFSIISCIFLCIYGKFSVVPDRGNFYIKYTIDMKPFITKLLGGREK